MNQPMQAILSATREAAALLDSSRDAGSVATGKWADIVAVEGNPLEDVRRLEKVAFVMKGGVVYKNAR